MEAKSIVMLAGKKESTNVIYNSLKDDFKIEKVILEERVPRNRVLRRRSKKLGLLRVLGQTLFRLIVVPCLKATSKGHILEIKSRFTLSDLPVDKYKVINVISANSEETIAALKELDPDIVVINGTRIIKSNVLDCTAATFINMHAGITPLYRGVHGAYWALFEENTDACGVTVHLVNTGIDTGGILEQGLIERTGKDNFVTYPLLQLVTGLPLLKKAIKDILNNRIEIKPRPAGKSRLWSHPTLWGYIWHRFCHGVK